MKLSRNCSETVDLFFSCHTLTNQLRSLKFNLPTSKKASIYTHFQISQNQPQNAPTVRSPSYSSRGRSTRSHPVFCARCPTSAPSRSRVFHPTVLFCPCSHQGHDSGANCGSSRVFRQGQRRQEHYRHCQPYQRSRTRLSGRCRGCHGY